MPATMTPMMMVTAIAQALTLISPVVWRPASFAAISRLRCLSYSEELIGRSPLEVLVAAGTVASNDDARSGSYRPFTKHMPMPDVLPATWQASPAAQVQPRKLLSATALASA
jgi:hypothetical protein